MEFSFLTLVNAGVLILLLLPNIFWTKRLPPPKGPQPALWLQVLEQLGRYGCMLLMVVPLFVGKFGFFSVGAMLVCFGGCLLLLALYWASWAAALKTGAPWTLWALAVLPCCLFLLCGITLHHWALVAAALVFAAAHLAITQKRM